MYTVTQAKKGGYLDYETTSNHRILGSLTSLSLVFSHVCCIKASFFTVKQLKQPTHHVTLIYETMSPDAESLVWICEDSCEKAVTLVINFSLKETMHCYSLKFIFNVLNP